VASEVGVMTENRELPDRDGLDREKLAILRREIAIGLDDAAAGRFSRKTVREIAEEVRREKQ
jgi:antitoxin ParD1/3/4